MQKKKKILGVTKGEFYGQDNVKFGVNRWYWKGEKN